MFRFGFFDSMKDSIVLEETKLETSPVKIDTNTTTADFSSKINQNVQTKHDLFFFHPNDAVLRNRLDEVTFCRSVSVPELFNGWTDKKHRVRNSYKRARKDSLKKMKRKT